MITFSIGLIWFEPTDIRKASKPFHSELWRSLHFISPNFNELRVMAKAAGYNVNASLSVEKNEADQILEEASKLAVSLVKHIRVSIVTLGKLGLMVVRRGLADEPLLPSPTQMKSETTISARVYSVPHLRSVVSVSGAGDCLAAGIMAAMLSGWCEADCVSLGVAAARISLQSPAAVPAQLLPICQLKQQSVEIKYSTLITVPN